MDPQKRLYKAMPPASVSPPSTLSPPSSSTSAASLPRARRSPHRTSKAASTSNDRVSDFIQSLVRILQDPSFQDIISWSAQGDCVVIKNTEDFAKMVLPRVFKHRNFASFVRQLNKYDFHKVKTDDEKSATFYHPDFRIDRLNALDSIKRKSPVHRQFSPSEHSLVHPNIPETSAAPVRLTNDTTLQSQIANISQSQNNMASHIRALNDEYQNVLTEFVGFQRKFAQQDGRMHDLMRHLIRSSVTPATDPMPTLLSSNSISDPHPFVHQHVLDAPGITPTTEMPANLRPLSKSSLLSAGSLDWTVTDTPRESASAPESGEEMLRPSNPPPGYFSRQQTDGTRADFQDDEMVMPTIQSNLSTESSLNNSVPMESSNPAPMPFSENVFSSDVPFSWPSENTYEELQIYTVGHQVMKDASGNYSMSSLPFDATMAPVLSSTGSSRSYRYTDQLASNLQRF